MCTSQRRFTILRVEKVTAATKPWTVELGLDSAYVFRKFKRKLF